MGEGATRERMDCGARHTRMDAERRGLSVPLAAMSRPTDRAIRKREFTSFGRTYRKYRRNKETYGARERIGDKVSGGTTCTTGERNDR